MQKPGVGLREYHVLIYTETHDAHYRAEIRTCTVNLGPELCQRVRVKPQAQVAGLFILMYPPKIRG